MIIPKENEKVHYIMTSIKIPLLRKPDGSVIPLTEFISADIELMKDLPEKPDYVLNNEYIKSKIDDLFIIHGQPRIDQCLIQNQETSAGQKSLTLVDLSSAFVIFGFGLSLAFLVFLLELIYKRFKDHYFTA